MGTATGRNALFEKVAETLSRLTALDGRRFIDETTYFTRVKLISIDRLRARQPSQLMHIYARGYRMAPTTRR